MKATTRSGIILYTRIWLHLTRDMYGAFVSINNFIYKRNGKHCPCDPHWPSCLMTAAILVLTKVVGGGRDCILWLITREPLVGLDILIPKIEINTLNLYFYDATLIYFLEESLENLA